MCVASGQQCLPAHLWCKLKTCLSPLAPWPPTGVFGLPGGLAPLAAALPLTPTARFGGGLLAATVVTISLLTLAARRLTAPARASSAVVKEELSEASQVERTPLAGTPPASLPDAQKLAALSTAADLFIGVLFALGLGASGMLKPSKVAGEAPGRGGDMDAPVVCRMPPWLDARMHAVSRSCLPRAAWRPRP